MEYFFVYILKCFNGSYYVGHTDNIEKRISEHKLGTCTYTKDKLPIEVIFTQTFSSRDEAIIIENRIKKWSRKKKEALIKQDWNEVRKLSKKKFKK